MLNTVIYCLTENLTLVVRSSVYHTEYIKSICHCLPRICFDWDCFCDRTVWNGYGPKLK